MKFRVRNVWIIAGLIATLGVFGCGTGDAVEEKQTTNATNKIDLGTDVQQEKNSLDSWQNELDTDTEKIVNAKAIRGLRIIDNEEPVYAVSYEPRVYKNSYDCWSLSEPYKSWVTVDTEGMYQLFDKLPLLMESASEIEGTEETGLEESKTSIFVAYDSTQDGENAGSATPDSGITYWVGNEDGVGNRYLKTSVNDKVWKVSSEALAEILQVNSYDSILKIAGAVSIETVSDVEIIFEDEKYDMVINDDLYYFGNKKTEDSDFFEIYSQLVGFYIEDELPSDFSPKEDRKVLLNVVFNRNIEDAPQICMTYYEYDDTFASLMVNGAEFFLVKRSSIDDVEKAIEEAFR